MASGDSEGLRSALSTQAALLSELVSTFLERPLREAGLTLGAFELLSAVKAADSKDSQAQLAERIGIRTASLCEAVKSAASKGLVTQQSVSEDRRAKRIALTPKGSKVLGKCLTALESAEVRLVKGIAAKDLRSAVRVLERASQNLTTALANP